MGFFAKPGETGVRGASFVCMLTARFVLKYINVYHEVACDGNLYLVLLDFFFSLLLYFLRLGYVCRSILEESVFSHMIYP